MDLFDVARACARRWLLFIPLCALVLLFAYHKYSGVGTVYYGSTTLGLSSPSLSLGPGQQGPINGLANSGGVTFIANLLTLNMSDASVRGQIATQGGLPDYTATVFTVPGGGQLPLVVLSATGADPDAVTRTLQLATAQSQASLQTLQESAGVPGSTLFTAYPVIPPGAPVPGTPSRMKSTIALLAAGLGFAVIVTVLVDLYLNRWTKRRESRQSSARSEALDDSANASNGHRTAQTAGAFDAIKPDNPS